MRGAHRLGQPRGPGTRRPPLSAPPRPRPRHAPQAVKHPRERRGSQVVRMDVFWSMWRSRAVECPWGSGRPATETVLLHHEQFKIPERLARFAVTHGMWGFVKKLSSTLPQYVEARRRRCDPWKEDPAAYGAGFKPNPPGRHGCGDAEGSGEGGGAGACAAYRPRKRGLPAAAALVLVGGVALAVGAARSSSGGGAQDAPLRRRQRREERREERREARARVAPLLSE
jgi:hypothetical protein